MLDYYKNKLEAMSLSKQIVFMLIAFLSIYFVWYLLLFSPVREHKIETQGKLKDMHFRLADLQTKLKASGGNLAEKKTINNPQAFTLQVNKVIPLMKELISKQPGLELVNVTSQPPQPLKLEEVAPSRINPNREEAAAAEEKKRNEAKTGEETSGLFKQVITLQFRGNYFSTLEFIEKIETLPWVLIPDHLAYVVNEYPQANITLQLNLLSFAQGFM